MIEIDGSEGEGGGQILRTSLALSLITATPVRITNIRGKRSKPGLLKQHLTGVKAAEAVGRAQVEGAKLGSPEITFVPGTVQAGDYTFSIGTAGSAALVFQTVLPPLLMTPGRSTLRLEGGTHNSKAPPFHFLAHAFAPFLRDMGAELDLALDRYGFYPAGGGAFTATVSGGGGLRPIERLERGPIEKKYARAIVSKLPRHVAERELKVIAQRHGFEQHELEVIELTGKQAIGPGNVLMVEIEASGARELFSGMGEKGTPAERVAGDVLAELDRWLALDVPIGEHLADQILIPLALAGGGSFRTVPLTLHTTTNIDVLRRFLPVDVRIDEEKSGAARVTVERRSSVA